MTSQEPQGDYTSVNDRAFNDPDPMFTISEGTPEEMAILQEQGVQAWLAWVKGKQQKR